MTNGHWTTKRTDMCYLELFNQWEIKSPSKIGNYFENFDGSA